MAVFKNNMQKSKNQPDDFINIDVMKDKHIPIFEINIFKFILSHIHFI